MKFDRSAQSSENELTPVFNINELSLRHFID